MKPRRLTLRELTKPTQPTIVECRPLGPYLPERGTVTIYELETPLELMSKFPHRGPRYERPTRYDPPPE